MPVPKAVVPLKFVRLPVQFDVPRSETQEPATLTPPSLYVWVPPTEFGMAICAWTRIAHWTGFASGALWQEHSKDAIAPRAPKWSSRASFFPGCITLMIDFLSLACLGLVL